MFLTLSYQLKTKAIKQQPKSSFDTVVVYGAVKYYFTNPIVAFRAKQYLNKNNKSYTYKITPISKDIANSKEHFETYEDFLNSTQNNIEKNIIYNTQEMDI